MPVGPVHYCMGNIQVKILVFLNSYVFVVFLLFFKYVYQNHENMYQIFDTKQSWIKNKFGRSAKYKHIVCPHPNTDDNSVST